MTTPTSILHHVPGGARLVEWFGQVPRFHDAELLEIGFFSKGTGLLRIHAWTMTNEVDSRGYFILDRHAVVSLTLEGVSAINCADFHMVPGIILDFEIAKADEEFRIEWAASYGVDGSVTCKTMRIDLEPGKPE